jgi:hypothetical protein
VKQLVASRMLREWLAPVDPPRRADLIFVLAGREFRKRYGLKLLRQGLAPRILFSVARFEIRSFSKLELPKPLDLLGLAARVAPPERHYFVEFEKQNVAVEHVRPGRFGTLTEIASLARWLDAHPQIHSVLLISSAIHLRRVMICCRFLLRATTEIALLGALPDSSTQLSSTQDGQPESKSAVGAEVLKVALYWLLLMFRRTKIL